MRTDLKKKLIQLFLQVFGVMCVLFLILFNSTWYTIPPKPIGLDFALSFLVPFLVSIICFLASGYFKVFTKDDAIEQVERQYKSGLMSFEQYKNTIRGFELWDLEKNKMRALLEAEKKKIKEDLLNEVQKIQKEFLQEQKEEELDRQGY